MSSADTGEHRYIDCQNAPAESNGWRLENKGSSFDCYSFVRPLVRLRLYSFHHGSDEQLSCLFVIYRVVVYSGISWTNCDQHSDRFLVFC